MIRRLFKNPYVRISVVIYGVLWIVTAKLADAEIDRAFDKQFRYGQPNWDSDEVVEIKRIQKFYGRNPEDPRNEALIPANRLFRYRSRGITIAPFFVVDEVGTVFAPLGGAGGLRLILWFFDSTKTCSYIRIGMFEGVEDQTHFLTLGSFRPVLTDPSVEYHPHRES